MATALTTCRNLALASLIGLAMAHPGLSHSKGLYRTQAEAEKRAKELGCVGTHTNNGLWMPCRNETHLHRELREQ